jgi:hypothetical protein
MELLTTKLFHHPSLYYDNISLDMYVPPPPCVTFQKEGIRMAAAYVSHTSYV